MYSVRRLLQFNSYWGDFCTCCTIILFRRVLFCALEEEWKSKCKLFNCWKSMCSFDYDGYQLVHFENSENQCAFLKGVEIKV